MRIERRTLYQIFKEVIVVRSRGRRQAQIKSGLVLSSLMMVLSLSVAFFGASPAKAWGPVRPTFTIEQPSDHVVFNSITNSPDWGDERNMTVIKDVTGQENNGNTAKSDGFSDTSEFIDGHTYMVKMLVHNNAAANLNLSATNTRLNLFVPSASGDSAMIQGSILADNCGKGIGSPCSFWDEAYIRSADKSFKVQYVAGSGRFYNNTKNFSTSGFTLSDDATKPSSALVGYNKLDGNIPGCYQYSGYATFLVKATAVAKQDFHIRKEVKIAGTGTKAKRMQQIKAQPGDVLEYAIAYYNTGDATQQGVIVKDNMARSSDVVTAPDKKTNGGNQLLNNNLIEYIKGSTKLINSSNQGGLVLKNDNWASDGLNIGSYTKGANAFVTYQARIASEDKFPCDQDVEINNTVQVYTKEAGKKLANAKVIVHRTCKSDTPKPPAPTAKKPTNKPKKNVPKAPRAGIGLKAGIAGLLLIVALGVAFTIITKNKTNKSLNK